MTSTLPKDFKEEAYRAVAVFEASALKDKHDTEEVMQFVDTILKVVHDDAQTEFDAVTRIITYSSYNPSLQRKLLWGEFYRILADVYMREIDKDARKMLYIMSVQRVYSRDSHSDELLSPLREYARDRVLLNSTERSGKYEPSWYERSADFNDGIIPPELRNADLIDVLSGSGLINHRIIRDYIISASESAPDGKKAKAVIPIFKALEDLGLISEAYAEAYTRPVELSLFISKLTGNTFTKDDVIFWTPGRLKSSRYVNDEIEKHKKTLRSILVNV